MSVGGSTIIRNPRISAVSLFNFDGVIEESIKPDLSVIRVEIYKCNWPVELIQELFPNAVMKMHCKAEVCF